MNDPYNLQRFVDAQASSYEAAKQELSAGRKRSHWMWFVFPQVHGLGSSDMARRHAIGSLDEARAYLAHPVLGPRLRGLSAIVAGLEGLSAIDIFGSIDAMKFRSSMTLFNRAGPEEAAFADCLQKYFDGQPAPLT